MSPAVRSRPVPSFASVAVLAPGADAIRSARDPASVILDRVRRLGFDGLSYFPPPAGAADPLASATWSTWSPHWHRAYDDGGYADVDPRIVATAGQSLPCVWDGGTIVARGRLRCFLAAAAREGIRSGVAVPVGTARGRAVVAFDSSDAPLSPARHAAIRERLGETLCVAHAVHASRHTDPPLNDERVAGEASGALSGREQACLAMSARGLTSRDIATKLGIKTRTVDFHVGNAISKLAALNRREAIAKAVARGWLG